jgi:hypothetical protein
MCTENSGLADAEQVRFRVFFATHNQMLSRAFSTPLSVISPQHMGAKGGRNGKYAA